MEPDLALSKEELRDADCCRFCGGTGTKAVPLTFIPIFGPSQLSQELSDRLDILINRYLPIKVHEEDNHYPRLICSACYSALRDTIVFFDRISEGQKVLHKILNKVTSRAPTLSGYSGDNPVLNTSRRRGRPRRDPNLPRTPKPPPPPLPEETGKPRRTVRAPDRYADYLQASIKLEPEDGDCNYTTATGQPRSGSEDPLRGTQMEAAQILAQDQDSLSLNVIMDGDEDGEEGGTQLHVDISAQLDESPQVPPEPDIYILPSPPSPTIRRRVGRPRKKRSERYILSSKLSPPLKRGRGRPKKRKRKRTTPQCQQCFRIFGHSSSLLYHMATAHHMPGGKMHCCPICAKSFKHKALLASHRITHSTVRSFKCTQCPKAFKTQGSLYIHTKTAHWGIKEYSCETCKAEFKHKSSLKCHMYTHSGERPYSCQYCGKGFTQRSNLREHLRTHTKQRPFSCAEQDCGKTFITHSQLKSHKSVHSGVKPYLCNICGKTYTTSESFRFHMRRHYGEKPVDCPLCEKQFVEPCALKKHFRTHTGRKPYFCDHCDKCFADSSNFIKHKRLHLTEPELADSEEPKSQEAEVNEGQEEEVGPEQEMSQIQVRTVYSHSHGFITGAAAGENSAEMLGEHEGGSLVQILNAEGLLENGSHDGVIYVYPDDLPIFTITLNDSEHAIEVRANNETTLHALGNLSGGPITFATVEGSDLSGQYFNLESVPGSRGRHGPSERSGPHFVIQGTSEDVSGRGESESTEEQTINE